MFQVSLPLPPYGDLESSLQTRRDQYQAVLEEMAKEISGLMTSCSIRASVKFRVKSAQSLYAKLLRRAREASTSTDVIVPTDLLGIRIVTPFLAGIRSIEDQIDAHFKVREKQRKGDDLGFKEFGYESLHYLITCPDPISQQCGADPDTIIEIQIRTLLQDAWAEVEHELIYKSEASPLDEPIRRRLAAINANLNLADIMFQEIRDYQRSLKEQLKQRRHAFWDKVNASGMSPFEPETRHLEPESPTLPRYADQKLLEGLIAHNRGDHDLAIMLYTEILDHETRPEVLAIVHLHRGMAHFTLDRFDEAFRDFEAAVEADPANDKGYLYLGVLEATIGTPRRALEYLEMALERDPYSLDALMERAKLRYDSGNLESCAEDCRSILAIDPEHTKASELLEMCR
jgi:putative GTP pyrophosphokinase